MENSSPRRAIADSKISSEELKQAEHLVYHLGNWIHRLFTLLMGIDETLDEFIDLCRGLSSNELIDDLSTRITKDGGDGFNRDGAFVVYVHLGEHNGALMLIDGSLQNWGQHLARTAPAARNKELG